MAPKRSSRGSERQSENNAGNVNNVPQRSQAGRPANTNSRPAWPATQRPSQRGPTAFAPDSQPLTHLASAYPPTNPNPIMPLTPSQQRRFGLTNFGSPTGGPTGRGSGHGYENRPPFGGFIDFVNEQQAANERDRTTTAHEASEIAQAPTRSTFPLMLPPPAVPTTMPPQRTGTGNVGGRRPGPRTPPDQRPFGRSSLTGGQQAPASNPSATTYPGMLGCRPATQSFDNTHWQPPLGSTNSYRRGRVDSLIGQLSEQPFDIFLRNFHYVPNHPGQAAPRTTAEHPSQGSPPADDPFGPFLHPSQQVTNETADDESSDPDASHESLSGTADVTQTRPQSAFAASHGANSNFAANDTDVSANTPPQTLELKQEA